MFLKAIKAQGFKSFADKINLEFSDGVTAVVGPNGSGKSNISDAVRWVLGEQSAKSLRGGSMQDIIFAGTQQRKPLGLAEVTLVLDNSTHIFHIDFEELAVTRRVYRSGESEYLINGAQCRLKDIQEVFMDTGLGKDGYSIIGQGKVEEILSSKADDRRQIFEEASGISKYRHRKEEAQRKLAATEDNLSRILDILAELDSQLGPLEKQSEKAKQYLKLKEELKTFEVSAALSTIDKSRAELGGIQEKFDIVSAQLEHAKNEMETAEKRQEELYQAAGEKERFARDSEAELHNKEAETTRFGGEIEVLTNTIEGNKTLAARVEAEIGTLVERIESLDGELSAARAQAEELTAQAGKIESEMEALKQESEALLSGAQQQNGAIEEKKLAVTTTIGEISELRIQLSNLDVMAGTYRTRRETLREELEQKQADRGRMAGNIEETKAERDRKADFVAKTEARLAEITQQGGELKQRAEADRAALTELNIKLNDKRSRFQMLSAMEQNYEGYNKSVKSVMKEYESGSLHNAKIWGPVSKLVRSEGKYVTAVETALGFAMQNIVVETEFDAKSAIDFLKRSHAGRATFLPVTAMRGRVLDDREVAGEPGFVGIASELVEFDRHYAGVVESLLGRTVVVDTIDSGIAMSKRHKNAFRIVTLTGEVFNAGGSMAGGSTNRQASLLGRESEIAALKKEVERFTAEFQELEKRLGRERDRLEALGFERQNVEAVLHENREILVKLENDIHYGKSMLSGSEEAIAALLEEDGKLQDKLEAGRQQAEQFRAQIAEKEQAADAVRSEIGALEESYEQVLVKNERLQNQIVDKTVEKNAVEKDLEVSQERIRALCAEQTAARDSLEMKRIEVRDINEKNGALTQDIEMKQKQIAANRDAVKLLSERVGKLLEAKTATEEESRRMQEAAKEFRETVYNLQQEFSRIEGRKVKSEMELDTAVNRLWDEYELTYSTAQSYRCETGPETARRITELKAAIRALGNVNVDAIEEFRAVRERHEFLSTQSADMTKAKENLLALIEEMESVMQEQFTTQFDIINSHFRQTFTELFGGGRAELRLTDRQHVLESGVDIDVQPPGKKLQSLSLLSGGERALSAIALLFAILKTRPTPFCFLDEIEAALDDVNVFRFAEYVRNYSGNTQFIIVTHRRGTMEAADVIYGVTMQEKGVSKLLKLDVDEAMTASH